MKPIGEHLIVVAEKDSEYRLEGGLILAIPQTADQVERPNRGIVISTGENSPVKVGSNILFNRFAGARFEINRKEHIVLSNDDVLVDLEKS
jgi:co-chaperonin GroES (HSP10)